MRHPARAASPKRCPPSVTTASCRLTRSRLIFRAWARLPASERNPPGQLLGRRRAASRANALVARTSPFRVKRRGWTHTQSTDLRLLTNS